MEIAKPVVEGSQGHRCGHVRRFRKTKSSRIKTTVTDTRKTRLPIAFRRGERPERSIDQISTGRVTSKRVSRKAIMNSSQLKVIDRKKAAAMAGISIGTVISSTTCASFAP